MISSQAKSPEEYIAELPPERREAMYLNNVYGDADVAAWFRERFAASGHRLDMGKSCVRFRRVEDLPLDLIGETIARTPVDRFVARYRTLRGE